MGGAEAVDLTALADACFAADEAAPHVVGVDDARNAVDVDAAEVVAHSAAVAAADDAVNVAAVFAAVYAGVAASASAQSAASAPSSAARCQAAGGRRW